uniref:Uncharacterized protein n=1 Tax=Thermosporothrix sp. COM3 TaxID=2490863 RepID=A0A455SEU8_9CHLR|nr:hypothetical protein KTC_17440 [Thermosporothrix sp. COM3]
MCRGKKESSLEKGLLLSSAASGYSEEKDVAPNINGTFSICELFMF